MGLPGRRLSDMSARFFVTEPNASSVSRFALVDIEVIRDESLAPCAKAVYAVICIHANPETRTASLKVSVIAREAGCCKRTAQESLKALADRGVIECETRFDENRQAANLCRVIGYKAKCYADRATLATLRLVAV
jgi:hypothetical protein